MKRIFNTISVTVFLIIGMVSFSTSVYGRRPVGNATVSRADSHRSANMNGKRQAVRGNNSTFRSNSRQGYAGSTNNQIRANAGKKIGGNGYRSGNRNGVSVSKPSRRASFTGVHNNSSVRSNVNVGNYVNRAANRSESLSSTSARRASVTGVRNNSSVRGNVNVGNYGNRAGNRSGVTSSTSSGRASVTGARNNSSVRTNGNIYVGNSHRGGQGSAGAASSSRRDGNYGYGGQSQSQRQYGYGNQYQNQYQYGCNNNYYYNYNYRPYRKRGYYCPPPVRPYRPSFVQISRPVYPVNYHPLSTAPLIRGILGLTFGVSSYVASLDYFFNNNYYIDGYDNGYIYLRNVNNMGYYWDDVILNYSSLGYLNSTQFVKSYSYADNYMFNNLYNQLCYQYGSPVAYNNNMYGTTSTWYGRDGRTYLTLSYSSQYVNGYVRYYTTLTYTGC